jgi:hypothetical protein
MKQLKEYIYENINEGIIKGIISLSFIKKISPEDLLNGIMNMYEYICNNEDIELFFQDFQFKERVFWKNLYEMYTKKVWSIFDMNDNEDLSKLGLQENVITKISVEMRRNLRDIIKQSQNSTLDLKASEIESIIPITDPKDNKIYFITLNRTKGALNRVFRAADIKLFETALMQIGVAVSGENKN